MIRRSGHRFAEKIMRNQTWWGGAFEQGEIGPGLFEAACRMGLEGLVSKHRERVYRGGRSPDWIKVKNRKHPAFSRVADRFWDTLPLALQKGKALPFSSPPRPPSTRIPMPNEKIAANKVYVNLPALERSPGRQAPFAYWDNEPAISDALHGVHVRQFHPLNVRGPARDANRESAMTSPRSSTILGDGVREARFPDHLPRTALLHVRSS
jgi:hypothetical protein